MHSGANETKDQHNNAYAAWRLRVYGGGNAAYHADVVTIQKGLSELDLLLLAIRRCFAVFTKSNVILVSSLPCTTQFRSGTYYSVTSSSTMSVPQNRSQDEELSVLDTELDGRKVGLILTDVVIESKQSATELSIRLHNDPNAGTDALVNQL